MDTSRFVHVFNTVAAALQLVVWWEHVPSAANVADLPSRDGSFRDAPLRATLDAAEILEVAWPDSSSWVLPSADLAPLYERLAGQSRKRARAIQKASRLSNADILDVLRVRQQNAAKRAAAASR